MTPDVQPYRILVIDDEAIIITQLEELLESLGYDVVAKASSGKDAVRLARELSPDLVLMDIVMPGEIDGIEACETIQAEMDIPVVLLTAYGDDSHVERAKHARPYGYILKPSQNDQIKATIEIVLEKKAVERDMDEVLKGLRSRAVDQELQLKEIHHRIKNNLSMIGGLLSLQAMHLEDDKCLEVVKAVRSRVLSIAKVHEALYSSKHLDSINACDYFESLADTIRRSYVFPRGVTMRVECEPIELEPDKVMPMGLMMTELLTNALKYAFPEGRPGEISLRFRKEQTSYQLRVSDDGVGLPKDFDINNVSTLGLELVGGLVNQVGGKLQHDGSNGTSFAINIPF